MNRLAQEKSPYLQQHQNNPVDWYPWGPEAFEVAKRENKPIFLSIGYSTCHWCHVMEHESFEDPFVATLMNQSFVNIKVDREERPDIDHVYMTVCQIMTGQGGWPLTIIMTPEQKPFFAGTYIPKTTKHGHLGLVDLIPRVQELWIKSPDKVSETAESLVEALNRIKEGEAPESLSGEILHHGFEFHSQSFDEEWGGFGQAPKFPSLHHLQFLFRYGERYKSDRARDIALFTLKNILAGGIYDHVGGGIHRYSVDGEWFVPHFEKMLYDQAMLVRTLAEASLVQPDPVFKELAQLTVNYLETQLLSPEGGFYCGEDADSERVEGKFYLWSKIEFTNIIKNQGFINEFQLDDFGNFSEHGQLREGNILRFSPAIQAKLIGSPDWTNARKALLTERSKRIRPSLDKKILTDWNALTVSALALAGRVYKNQAYIDRAKSCMGFIEKHLTRNNSLYHRYCEGEVLYTGNIDDHAFMLEAYIELYQATFEVQWLKKAKALANDTIEKFWDEKSSAFYFAAADAEKLIVRKKEFYDGAYPSGNSAAVYALLKLSRLIGESRYEDMATQALQALSGNLSRSPAAFTYTLCALDFLFGPNREFVVVGSGKLAAQAIEKLNVKPRFCDLVHWSQVGADNSDYSEIAPYLKELKEVSGLATLYICENFACKSPQTLTPDLIEKL